MTTDTYKPKLIARVLKAHHERHHQGFICQADGRVYYQARAVRGWLEITPNFGLSWVRLQECEAVFTDRAGQSLTV